MDWILVTPGLLHLDFLMLPDVSAMGIPGTGGSLDGQCPGNKNGTSATFSE